jgi:hypothetical protein
VSAVAQRAKAEDVTRRFVFDGGLRFANRTESEGRRLRVRESII